MRPDFFLKFVFLFLALAFLSTLSSCKKDDESSQWTRCTNCSQEQISGKYAGVATLYEYNMESEQTGQTYSEEAYLEISPQGSGIRITVGVVNLYNASISAAWEDGNYTISSLSDGEFFASVWVRDNQIKITGINKRSSPDPDPEPDSSGFILRSLFDFEVVKTE
ncbi:MAG: hypothetical protein M0Q90_13620 [Bacteroidales bacterium]|nr:hypothetical protein [Bacteroidales bacterium]